MGRIRKPLVPNPMAKEKPKSLAELVKERKAKRPRRRQWK